MIFLKVVNGEKTKPQPYRITSTVNNINVPCPLFTIVSAQGNRGQESLFLIWSQSTSINIQKIRYHYSFLTI